MLYMSRLGADVVAEISIDDEDDEDAHAHEEESGVCSSSHCHIVITGGSIGCRTMHRFTLFMCIATTYIHF